MSFEIDRPFFPAGYITIGMLHCPRCMAMREFIVPPDLRSNDLEDQAAAAECCECSYHFGKKQDETVIGPDGRYTTQVSGVLSPKTIRRAQERRLAEHRQTMLASGVRLERLDGRVPAKPRVKEDPWSDA